MTMTSPSAGPGGARPGPRRRPGEFGGGGGGGGRKFTPRRKVCQFCAEKLFEVDYKAVHVLRNFITEALEERLRAEDEAEVERLYQRLKTVGNLDQKNSTDEK